MSEIPGSHPGRPPAPPPGWGPPPAAAPPPGAPAAPGWGGTGAGGPAWGGPPPAPGGGGSGRGPLPWILVGALVVVVVLIVGAVVVLSGDDEAEAGEIFLEPATEAGADPFATGLKADAVEVTTTTQPPATTTDDGAAATPSISGGRPGLYGGTRNAATCDPQQQADFLAANRPIAVAFVAALNADPTLRWSGGSKVSVDQIEAYLLELTPVTLTSDTRVTNHGYSNGRPTPRQAVLQAGTAVLVDAYGVPRVKCNCGNPLTAPTAVRVAPVYRGPRWTGFSPTTVVVVTEVTVEIDVYVLVDVETGDPFSRPTGTTGAEDADADLSDDDTTSSTEPPTTEPPSTEPPSTEPPTTDPPVTSGGDAEQFCSKWSGYLTQYGEVDPTLPEAVAIFEDLESVAPPEMKTQMQLILEAVRGAAASGSTELDTAAYPGVEDALFAVIAYLEGTCGISIF